MSTTAIAYGSWVTTWLSQDQAVERAKALLKDEGFGLLCEIDVARTLQEKLGAHVPPYRILGACDPQLAHRALAMEPQLGLLLPCNVVVQQRGTVTVVSAVDARALLGIVKNKNMLGIADEVNARLMRVLEKVQE